MFLYIFSSRLYLYDQLIELLSLHLLYCQLIFDRKYGVGFVGLRYISLSMYCTALSDKRSPIFETKIAWYECEFR